MDTLAIQHSTYPRVMISEAELIKNATEIIELLQQCLAHNAAYISGWQTMTVDASQRTHDIIDIFTINNPRDAPGIHTLNGISAANGVIEAAIKATLGVINSIVGGKPLYNTLFLSSTSDKTLSAFVRLSMSRIIDAVNCPQCRGVYSRVGLGSHIGSLKCLRDQQCIDIIDKGYGIIDDSSAVVAIRKAGLEYQVRPSALDMWAPAWIVEAIKKYRANKGYADLKLHEFLGIMKDKNDE